MDSSPYRDYIELGATLVLECGAGQTMRVLVTGHNGYIGAVLTPMLQQAGHHVVGLDTYFFDDCRMAPHAEADTVIRKDIRHVAVTDVEGCEAVVHLAALSNDPLGNLNQQSTYDINARATLSLARAAKAAGVARFAFSSSCSIYGAASPDDVLDESAQFNPVTPYGESKVISEGGLAELADTRFSPVFLRNATAYGYSPKLRADLVVNNLVGWAYLTGEVLIMSDGTPWRPLVHVEDIARAFLAVLDAPRETIHGEAFNVGRTVENYQIRQVAELVEEIVPDSRVTYAADGGPDARCYRADFHKIETTLPGYEPQWTVRDGIEELLDAYRRFELSLDDFEGSRYVRLKRLREHIDTGRLDHDLFWQPPMQPQRSRAG